MSGLPQLLMKKANISKLPPILLKNGMELIHHREGVGMEAEWEAIIESAFERHYSFSFMIKAGDYKPEHVLYLTHNSRFIATASAVESPMFPGVGWYRMVGVRKDAQGLGAGTTIALAALHALRDRGYTEAMLSTDDERLPAISMYLSLGFEPYYTHESHKERWEKVLAALKKG
ncbi:MAG: GNAT family N-acetyltransferase [Clostridia bacterium]|nr:GNAT family N-acetyltransferase [Clostridia bacterium]